MDTSFIDKYNDLRGWALAYAKRDESLWEYGYWFKSAISEHHITLCEWGNGLNCSGWAYTMQTMSNEQFDFTIPWEQIPEDLL